MYTLNKLYYVACTQGSPCGTYIDDPDMAYILIRFKGENLNSDDNALFPLLFENVKVLNKRKQSLPYSNLGTSTYYEDGYYYDVSHIDYDGEMEDGVVKELPIKALK